MLPVLVPEPFDSPEYVFDLKWSGLRALAYVDGSGVRLRSQSEREITGAFPELESIARQVRASSAVIDGEIVALGPDGSPDISLVCRRLLTAGTAADTMECSFQASDLLSLDGRSLLDQPLSERKTLLYRTLVASGTAVAMVSVEEFGIAFFEAVATRRLAGIVGKRKKSPYLPGRRSLDWQEVRVYESDSFVVGGYTLGRRREAAISTLLLGQPTAQGGLRYVGQVQAGAWAEPLEFVLAGLASAACPFVTPPEVPRLLYWLHPEAVCDVKYASRQADGRLRFPVLVAPRPDLAPGACMPLPWPVAGRLG